MPRQRVVVAMSGGVDSSLSAALLKKAGYDVIGVTMQIWPADAPDKDSGCCGTEAVASAKRVAYQLGISHFVMNFRDIFAQQVIADFCQEYACGRTPNPCIRCNQYIKFGALMERAKWLDADYLSTGHYARIEASPDGYRLLKAVDFAKDQSYFLYTLAQRELSQLLMPIGNMLKTEVRQMAAELGLPSADRRESQDICFIPDNDYRSFVARYIPLQPGDIVDSKGVVLGRHCGLAQYTIGQRHGLGIAADQPLYVLKLLVDTNQLLVGREDQLLTSALIASRLTWVSGQAPGANFMATAKIRHRSPEVPVKIRINGNTAIVIFEQPQRAVTPGQSIVFYQGEVVLGGGIIEDSEDATDTNVR